MAPITGTVLIDGQPLKRALIEHIIINPLNSYRVTIRYAFTNASGRFTFESLPFSSTVSVQVNCHNTVLQVLDDNIAPGLNKSIFFEATIRNGDVINVPTHLDHFRILNKSLDIYDVVWRQFIPFSRSKRKDFPLGKKSTIASFLLKRIQIVFPEIIPGLPYTQPVGSLFGGYPLVHLKSTLTGGDVFDPLTDDKIIAHELGHAFHFALMSFANRTIVETNYLGFMLSNLPAPIHDTAIRTTPFVAFIEAVGIFSETFFKFSKSNTGRNLRGQDLRIAFVNDDSSFRPSGTRVGTKDADGIITPSLTGDDVEGAVYGAMYLDLAPRIGLNRTVRFLLQSQASTFADYARYIRRQNDPSVTAHLNAVISTWRL